MCTRKYHTEDFKKVQDRSQIKKNVHVWSSSHIQDVFG